MRCAGTMLLYLCYRMMFLFDASQSRASCARCRWFDQMMVSLRGSNVWSRIFLVCCEQRGLSILAAAAVCAVVHDRLGHGGVPVWVASKCTIQQCVGK